MKVYLGNVDSNCVPVKLIGSR